MKLGRSVIPVAIVTAILTLVLSPVSAFADSVGGHARRARPVEDAPLATPAEQEPVEAGKTVDALTFSVINTTLIPGQQPWYGATLDPNDPNSRHFSITYQGWENVDDPDNDYIEGPDTDTGAEPDGVAVAGVTYDLILAVHPEDGYALAGNITVKFQGRSYKASVPPLFPAQYGFSSYYLIEIPLHVTCAYPTPLYRMYNTKTSEHLWTRNKAEYNSCGSGAYKDWRAEGIAWYSPVASSKPVYRLYNSVSGDHHYTTSLVERDNLVKSGVWRNEGVAFYSATARDYDIVTAYRVYNRRLMRGQHHYTKSKVERDSLVKSGQWRDEGVGFYGFKSAKPAVNY